MLIIFNFYEDEIITTNHAYSEFELKTVCDIGSVKPSRLRVDIFIEFAA